MNAPLHREMPAGLLDAGRALSDVTARWDGDIVRQITDYIAIPAKSPGFDKDWAGMPPRPLPPPTRGAGRELKLSGSRSRLPKKGDCEAKACSSEKGLS